MNKSDKLILIFGNLMFIIFILLFSLLFYIPIFVNPNILVNRGNDLTNFFFPIFYFTKDTILKFHQIPLWNNLFFSGTPLLPDPQAPIFYLPNIIFFFFKSIDSGFIFSVFIHIFIASIGMYLLSRQGFKIGKTTSLICSFIYIASPKLSGYIEAGHFGLITSWSWLPFVFLFTILLARKPNIKKTILLSVFLALVFYSHILIFAICSISVSILFIFLKYKNIKYLFISAIITFGLIAIGFLPQLSWQSQTTRNLLLNDPDVYPKWLGIKEFLKASISPLLNGPKFIWDQDSEKTIALGFFPSIFAFIGFLKQKRNQKIIILSLVGLILLISLNNISPIYDFLIKQNWYILLRVSTRFWFLVVFIFIFLFGVGVETLLKTKKFKFLVYVLIFISVIELFLTSWTKILKPMISDNNLASPEVYQFLSKDKSKFRVFCLERCLSQKEAAIYSLELAEGYGTLQQMNYYLYSEQLSQAFYRDRYTLSIPPFEIFEYEKLQPYSPNLSAYNIKYVISDHFLKDRNLLLIRQFEKYLIYQNKINTARSNYPIKVYTPNFIQVDTSNFTTRQVVLSEIYNDDWVAYLNGKNKTPVKATVDQTRNIEINKNIRFVDFIYQPRSFIIGLIITLFTIFDLIALFIMTSKILKRTARKKDS